MGFLSSIFGTKNNNDLVEMVKKGAFIVDVRTQMEFNEGSVPGAVNIPLEAIPNQLSKFKNKKDIICFCRSGARSGSARSFLIQNGFENIYNAGGIGNMMRIIQQSKS